MSRFKVYLKTFDANGDYDADFTDITEDVKKIGNIQKTLDNTEYGIGIFRNNSLDLVVRNDTGKYSESGSLRTIFKYKRNDTIIKINWTIRSYDLKCGFFTCGEEQLGEEVTVFEGLLEDVSTFKTVQDQDVTFTVLGYEKLFDREIVPYSTINNGDNISDVIYKCLNQTRITNLITVDASNISVGQDVTIDDKTSLENETVKSALESLLLISNSVLRIDGSTLYVSNRDANATLKKTFYGQAAISGIEDILNINNFKDGQNRLFNFWTWKDTSLTASDATSIDKHGRVKKELDSELISDGSTSKIQSLLDANRDEFANPKEELLLATKVDYENLDIGLLDRVAIDYPPIHIPFDNNPLPRYGQNLYGTPKYPYSLWSLRISSQDRFKVISQKIDTSKEIIGFGLRRI